MTRHQPDYYQILGLSPEATDEEIQQAAAALAAKFPEAARDPEANVAYRQLKEAYDVLGDPQQREAYDRERRRRSPELLEVSIQCSRRRLPALNSKQLLYVLVMLHAPSNPAQVTLPLNLALVFDRSTSMEGRRLERVKAATRAIVDKLAPSDVISLISFSDRAEIVFPAGNVEEKQAIKRRMQGVRPSGGTEIHQGLLAGVQQLRQAPLHRYVNHLVLLTDGHTYGDEEECLALAASAARQGITFSAYGIGSDWNDRFLDQLVAPSGGRSVYVDHPEQIVDSLQEQINGLGAIYAQNVRLRSPFPPGVSCRAALKLAPFSQPLKFEDQVMALGNLEMRAPLALLLELVVPPQKVGKGLHIPLKITADLPGLNLEERTFHYEANFDVVREHPELSPPPIVVRAAEMLNLQRMNEQVWEEFEAGNTLGATKRMEYLTTRLMAAGHTRLAQQASLEKQRMANMGTVSLDGRKKLKYGTRALITTALSFNTERE